jgi:serine protease Do
MKTTTNNRFFLAPLLALACVATLVVTMAANQKNEDKDAVEAKSSAKIDLNVTDQPISREGKTFTSFSPVVKKVTPSVVKVNVSMKVKQGANPLDEFGLNDPFLERFFGRRGQREMPMPKQHGLGSGVIVTRDGYILTNCHVVDGADEVKVTLQDGRDFNGKLIGKDPKTDVAVLKIEATDLPALQIADSDQIDVGDMVLAVGNPFGIGQTVTMGIISATGRGNMGLDYEDFIQTDAAINPGNSGGALVDVEGRLIGVNTMILSRSGGNQGIGFAVPSNLAKYVMENLVSFGEISRGYMGVLIQDITPVLAKKFELKSKDGVLIGSVSPKGPADKAGIKSGDVIVEFNGKPAHNSRQLKLMVSQTKPGSTVPVKLVRDGNTKTLDVLLKQLPDDDKQAKSDTDNARDTGTLNGVTVDDLDANARRELNIPRNIQGALVTQVEQDCAAAEVGLQAGDVIIEINRTPVKNAQDAVKLTENPSDKITLLKVWSKGNTRYVVVDESKN